MSSEVFVSYKREDEARVGRLVKALEGAKLSVWWDRDLPGGEVWRANIEAALGAAKIVVVCWTHASAGPAGDFVRDEASRAKARLVPVILERGVKPPLGFGEMQALDLSHWSGNTRDPFFQDLLALIIAKRDGKPAPEPKGPAARALKRFVYGGGLATLAVAIAGLVWSTPAARTGLCTLPVGQPTLSRTCCQAGFTEAPVVRDQAYTPTSLEKTGYMRQSETLFASEVEARADVAARFQTDAAMLCAAADAEYERVVGVSAAPTRLDCRETAAGWTCAADYRATCAVERRELIEACRG
jgi:hypothetical protein